MVWFSHTHTHTLSTSHILVRYCLFDGDTERLEWKFQISHIDSTTLSQIFVTSCLLILSDQMTTLDTLVSRCPNDWTNLHKK